MTSRSKLVLAAWLVFNLAACSSGTPVATPMPDIPAGVPAPAATPAPVTRAGTIVARTFKTDSGNTVAFQVFEPTPFVEGRKYPLVLHGHGYAGSRCKTEDENGDCLPIRRLRQAGIGVISFDQRGFGESTGSVRLMDPDFEGHDLVGLVDWAEANLPWLLYRDGNLVLGAYGGSYGGAFQLMLHRMDPKKRLDALAPDTIWYDLRYSFNPHGVFKSAIGDGVFAVGEQNSAADQDLYLRQAFAQANAQLTFTPAALNWLHYRSPDYLCGPGKGIYPPYEGSSETATYREAPSAAGAVAYRDGSSGPRQPYTKVDVLLTQGMRDTLFNFNEVYSNYQCLKALGGDVRVLTHQSGHVLDIPTYQGANGPFACGTAGIRDAHFAWFKLKLLREPLTPAEAATIDGDICLSIAADDAYYVHGDVDLVGGPSFPVARTANIVIGAAADRTKPTVIPLATVSSAGAVLGGIPRAHLDVIHPLPVAPPDADPIVFLGLGVLRKGTSDWILIDDMITPVRGLKTDARIEMNGIAERLALGDRIALLVYGNHSQFVGSFSRDATTPAVTVGGRVELPLREGLLSTR